MPCPAGMPADEFRAASYMVCTYWGPIVFGGERGVVFYASTGEANRLSVPGMANYWHAYEVFFVPGIFASGVVGNCAGGRILGRLGVFDAAVVMYPDIQTYMLRRVWGTIPMPQVYHAWTGFSMHEMTDDVGPPSQVVKKMSDHMYHLSFTDQRMSPPKKSSTYCRMCEKS